MCFHDAIPYDSAVQYNTTECSRLKRFLSLTTFIANKCLGVYIYRIEPLNNTGSCGIMETPDLMQAR